MSVLFSPTGCVVDTEANLPTTTTVTVGMTAVASDTGVSYRCVSLGPPVWTKLGGAFNSYVQVSFLVPSGSFLLMVKRLQLTGAQRGRAAGTARIRIT